MAGKAYARKKKRRRRRSTRGWGAGRVQHAPTRKVRLKSHMCPGGTRFDPKITSNHHDRVGILPDAAYRKAGVMRDFEPNVKITPMTNFVLSELTDTERATLKTVLHVLAESKSDHEYSKRLRTMTRKARKQIRALEATLWIGRSLAKAGTEERDVRHSRPPSWRDWKQAAHHIGQLRANECAPQRAVTLKEPRQSRAYGDGLDVESRAQMSARFEATLD